MGIDGGDDDGRRGGDGGMVTGLSNPMISDERMDGWTEKVLYCTL